jgi:hypothetical protein
MEEPEKTKEPTPEQAAAFMTVLTRALSTKMEQENKFEVAYANNFNFEPSTWDLKIIFGQLEQHTGLAEIDWHTAITIPWLQVKLVAYYLRVQAIWYELQNGPLNIPLNVMPPEPMPPVGEMAENSYAKAYYEAQKKIYMEMFSTP